MSPQSTLKNAKLLILASGLFLGVLIGLQSVKAAQTCECDNGLITGTTNITGGTNTWQDCNYQCKAKNYQRFRFGTMGWTNITNSQQTPTEICVNSGGTGLNAGGRCIGCEANGKVTGAGAGSVCQTLADYNDATLVGTPNEGGSYPVATTTAAAPLNTRYKLLESFPGFFKADTVMTDFPALVLAVYKFGIWTVGIAGLFMLTIGGFMYMASAGNKSSAGSAKGIMTDAIVGIIGALTAYLFLYVINPDLTVLNLNFTPVDITVTEGTPMGPAGVCQPVASGDCSVASLTSVFGTAAQQASSICNGESGGRAIPSGVDKCADGSVASWGLFQINITVHKVAGLDCPSAFSGGGYTAKNHACRVVNQQLYNQCVTAVKTASNNIAVAKTIYSPKQSWKQWGANKSSGCNFN